MKITILCESTDHPIYSKLENWSRQNSSEYEVNLLTDPEEIQGGDILFLISVLKIIRRQIRDKFRKSLVIHGSDLPKGKGWSPVVRQVLQGSSKITISLLEAADKVDTGPIWKKLTFQIEDHELYDEINEKIFKTELELMDFAVKNIDKINPQQQPTDGSTYFERLKPEDNEIDPNKSISEQFDVIRIADPNRFPVFFNLRGHRYKLFLRKF